MAKLLIYRGETLHDTRELSGETLKIGRSSQSDVVLEDPGKGVSRNHAELRFQDGRYLLVDLQSQNGIWVAGSRVASIALDPNVIATVGPFRLMVEAPAPALISEADTAPLEPTQFLQRSTDPLELLAVPPSAESPVASPPLPVVDEQPRAKPEERPAAQAAADPRAKTPDDRPRARTVEARPPATVSPAPPSGEQWYAQPRVLGGAIAALLLVALSGIVAYKLIQKPAPPVWDSAIAQALIASGRCQEAIEKEIAPALQLDPNNHEAQALRDKCANTPPAPAVQTQTTTSVPPAPTADDKLTEAESLIAANDCPKALETVNGVLAQEPDNARAKDVLAKVNACLNPAPAQAAAAEKPQLKPIPAKNGGLPPLPNESPKDYNVRVAAMRQQYNEALLLVDNQRYLQARRALDDLAQQVPPDYLDLAQRREELRAAMRAEAKNRLDAAQAADTRNEFDAAIDAYRRAHDLDPNIQIDAPIQRLNDRKLDFGRKRCQAGRLEYSFGNNITALPALQDAVKYLPANDECAVKARQILQQLGK